MDYIRIALGWLNEYAEKAFSNAQQMEAQHEKHPDKESPQAQGLHAMAEAHKAAAQVYWNAADALERLGRTLRNEPIPTKLTADAPAPAPAPEAEEERSRSRCECGKGLHLETMPDGLAGLLCRKCGKTYPAPTLPAPEAEEE